MPTLPVLQFDHVARSYRSDVQVLRDVSFVVQPQEVVALLGRNGAGKTTLIHLALGMLRPRAGTVRVFGLDPLRDPVAVKRRIGYVAEDQVLPAGMTVAEVLALHRRVFPAWDAALERDLLEQFGLTRGASRMAQLSRGEARQVALLCAVCHRPQLLILDEPAGGLDPATRREFLEAAIQLLNREGTAIFFSSHYMTDVERLAERALVLDDGRLILDEPLDELLDAHCVARIPRERLTDRTLIERMPGCLHLRGMLGEWHAVFRGGAAMTQRRLVETLGIAEVSCSAVRLEDLFVDLLGGERNVA